jgi:hypothetical protein
MFAPPYLLTNFWDILYRISSSNAFKNLCFVKIGAMKFTRTFATPYLLTSLGDILYRKSSSKGFDNFSLSWKLVSWNLSWLSSANSRPIMLMVYTLPMEFRHILYRRYTQHCTERLWSFLKIDMVETELPMRVIEFLCMFSTSKISYGWSSLNEVNSKSCRVYVNFIKIGACKAVLSCCG